MNKLDYLIRRNRGKRDLISYKKDLSAIFEIDFSDDDFLDLLQSDEITSAFYEAFKSSVKTLNNVYHTDHEHDLQRDIDSITRVIKKETGYLITSKSETCGVCEIVIVQALSKFNEVIELDGDSLCIMSIDKQKGIYLDLFEENDGIASSKKYELSVWGWGKFERV